MIIMRQNLHHFDDNNKFITLKQIQEIVDGFNQARIAIQAHVIELYQQRTKV